MALKGSYDYKGITVSDAYVKISSVNWSCNSNSENYVKTAAVYNSDGTVKTPEVTATRWVQNTVGNWHANVYKDKAARDANPNNQICSVSGSFDMDLKDSAKNPVKQAYIAAKTVDTYKSMADA
tara:strand:- start:1182 stop:1553 length:372 start_codon:yes stop_codon:yes gene_type:complete